MGFETKPNAVNINGHEVEFAGTDEEFNAYAAKLEIEARTLTTLSAAIASYANGKADYEGAYQKLRNLVLEEAKAGANFERIVGDIDAWMKSPITPHFDGNFTELANCAQAIARVRSQVLLSKAPANGKE